MKKHSQMPVDPLTDFSKLDAPQVFAGRVDERGESLDRADSGKLGESVSASVGNATDHDVVVQDSEIGSDNDPQPASGTRGSAELISDVDEDVLGGLDVSDPALGDVLRVHITRVIEAGCVVLDVFDKLNRLANRLYRRRDIAGRLELADRVNECADELWQEGLNITVGAETCQQLIDSLFETRSDKTVTHHRTPSTPDANS